MTTNDSLSLLLSLPAPRLCQMLCLLSRQQDLESAWACLVWIESERYHHSPLSGYTAKRWKQSLLAGGSLERLLNASQPFDSLVLELVTDSVFAPLFNARGSGPDRESLSATMASWDPKRDHLVLSLSAFMESLPRCAAQALLSLPGSDFLQVALHKRKSPPEHQRTALLFQVMLHLFYGGALPDTMLVDLYLYDNRHTPQEWEQLLQGLQRFPLALQTRRRDS